MGVQKENARALDSFLEKAQGKACYVYDLNEITSRYLALKAEVFEDHGQGALKGRIHYAVKANGFIEILTALKDQGAGVDVVSGGEVLRCLKAGFAGEDIIFSGVAKSHSEIILALENNLAQINVESPQELERIGQIAEELKVTAKVAFRWNPEVNPETHPYITTGLSENKFGMTKEFLPQLLRILKQYPRLHLMGLTMHIGSQIQNLSVYGEALEILKARYRELQAMGYPLETLDIGGGLGIDYGSGDHEKDLQSMKAYGSLVQKHLKGFDGEVLLEPGRILVARSGVLLCKVEYTKESPSKNFAIVNTGMHHLLRPALYQAQHRILPLREPAESSKQAAGLKNKFYDVVGPICESSDFLGKDRMFTDLEQGDQLAICDSGAYGFSMASGYNDHELPVEYVL